MSARSMKPAPFTLRRADSVDHALALLGDHGEDARVLAGGQSLMPLINLRLSQPALLVDLNGPKELHYVCTADSAVRFGALTRQRTLERDASTAKHVPLLAQAVMLVGHFQNRNRGTVGGSLAHADPAAELPTVAVALDAEMVVRGRDSTRTVDAKTFFQGPLTTALEPGELLVEARFPAWGRASSYREGACTILLDGHAVRSCIVLAAQVDGAEVTTVEGLSDVTALSEIQQAFADNHALQCGFCTPGFVVSLHEFLRDCDRAPTSHEICVAIGSKLCRCTGYQQIVEAVTDAYAAMLASAEVRSAA
jgi:CO/xanthine dehydrogenase FAD-binding subunit